MTRLPASMLMGFASVLLASLCLAAPAASRPPARVSASRVVVTADAGETRAEVRFRASGASGWRVVVSGEGNAGFYRQEREVRPDRGWLRAYFGGLGPGTRYFVSIEELAPPPDRPPVVHETDFWTPARQR